MSEELSVPDDSIEKRSQKILSELPSYITLVEELRPLKRPMLLWSAISLVYVYGRLHVSGDPSVWGVTITGVTDQKLTIFLFLATLYYTGRWAYFNWLKLRPYWRNGFIGELWKSVVKPQIATVTGKYYYFVQGYNEVLKEKGEGQVLDQDIETIESDRDLRSTVHDLFGLTILSSVMKFMEPFGVPYIFPLSVSCLALASLFCKII